MSVVDSNVLVEFIKIYYINFQYITTNNNKCQ